MREIKFKAWDIDNKRMCRVLGIWPNDDGTCEIQTMYANGLTVVVLGGRSGVKFNLIQYTGLKDKNSKEIFEGDILSNRHADFWDGEDPKDDESILEVRIDTVEGVGMYVFGQSAVTYKDEQSIYYLGQMEVIGNIYESPELLEDK